MNHFVRMCKHGVVVAQCRCPSTTKTAEVVACPPHCVDPEYDAMYAYEASGQADAADDATRAEWAAAEAKEERDDD